MCTTTTHDVVLNVELPANPFTQERLQRTLTAVSVVFLLYLKVRISLVHNAPGQLQLRFTLLHRNLEQCQVLGGAVQVLLTHVVNGSLTVRPPSATCDVGFKLGSHVVPFPSTFYTAVEAVIKANFARQIRAGDDIQPLRKVIAEALRQHA